MKIRLPLPRIHEAMASPACKADGFRFGAILEEAKHGPESSSSFRTVEILELPSRLIGAPQGAVVGRMAFLCIEERGGGDYPHDRLNPTDATVGYYEQ